MKMPLRGAVGAVSAALTLSLLIATSCSQASSSASQPAAPVAPAVPVSSAWSFGILSDTQWVNADDGLNPNTSAISIIQQVDQQFINKGVKLVVAVGDLADNTSGVAADAVKNEDVRATFAQDLYNAKIGFYPLRGNHDNYSPVATEFTADFPQTQNGYNNSTPKAAFGVQSTDPNTKPSVVTGSPFQVGTNFSSPVTATNDLNGLTYSFDYNNARFVLLDQFLPADKTNAPSPAVQYQYDGTVMGAQLPWISAQLSGKPAASHAFVFAHKGLITEDHSDVLFGNDPSLDPADQNTFFSALQSANVHLYIGGHDHMHDRTIVKSPDGKSQVTELVCASDSSKFYSPASPSNDQQYNSTPRQTSLSQELFTIGYYVVTVNGPQATVDFYSSPSGTSASASTFKVTPTLTFTKRESFGYSLNGKEFVVAQGAPYTTVQDTWGATPTTVKLLGGTNANKSVDGSGRAQNLAVDTGWTAKSTGLYSDAVTLWGLAYNLGSDYTDTVPVSVSFTGTPTSTTGAFGLLRLSADGTKWVNAVNENNGGTAKFVNGPWTAAYGLGTYGIDTTTTPATAWAVVNKAGTFAVGPIL